MAEYARIRRALSPDMLPAQTGGRRNLAQAQGAGNGAPAPATDSTTEPTPSQQAHFAELDSPPASIPQRVEPADLQLADRDDEDTEEASPCD